MEGGCGGGLPPQFYNLFRSKRKPRIKTDHGGGEGGDFFRSKLKPIKTKLQAELKPSKAKHGGVGWSPPAILQPKAN